MNVNRRRCCVRQAERGKSSSLWHWSRWSPQLSTWLVSVYLRLASHIPLTWSRSAPSCRWLFWSLTWLSCVKFVVERPATPPAILESNIISQPRPTRPCLPSCWSSLHYFMFCSAACIVSPLWRSLSRKSTALCINSISQLISCIYLFTPTTSTCTWSPANSFVQNYTNSFMLVAVVVVLLLLLLLLLFRKTKSCCCCC